MSLGDVRILVRGDLGEGLGNLVSWPNQNIPIAIPSLEDVAEADCVVQILNDVLAQCKEKSPEVSTQGGGRYGITANMRTNAIEKKI